MGREFLANASTPVIMVMVSISTILAIGSIYFFARELAKGSVKTFNIVLNIGVFIYLTGNICKFAYFGPSFIRWHLGDFGFAICVTSTFYLLLSKGTKKPNITVFDRKLTNLITEWLQEVRTNFVRSIVGGFIVCLAYEIFSGYLASTATKNFGIGKFDYIDVLAYLLAAILMLLTVVAQNKVSLKKGCVY